MSRTPRERVLEEHGFTLIELLVVTLIIGVLGAIALSTYIGQQRKGQDASAKTDARNLVTQLQACFADQQDFTKCDTSAELGTTGIAWGNANGEAEIVAATTDAFRIRAYSRNGGRWFEIERDDTGHVHRRCEAPGVGACKAADANGDMW